MRQIDLLRTNINYDIQRLLGLRSATAAEHAPQHPTHRDPADVEKDAEPQSSKRKRREVEIISSSSSSSSSQDSVRTQTGAAHVPPVGSPKSPVLDDRWDGYGLPQTIVEEVDQNRKKVRLASF